MTRPSVRITVIKPSTQKALSESVRRAGALVKVINKELKDKSRP